MRVRACCAGLSWEKIIKTFQIPDTRSDDVDGVPHFGPLYTQNAPVTRLKLCFWLLTHDSIWNHFDCSTYIRQYLQETASLFAEITLLSVANEAERREMNSLTARCIQVLSYSLGK